MAERILLPTTTKNDGSPSRCARSAGRAHASWLTGSHYSPSPIVAQTPNILTRLRAHHHDEVTRAQASGEKKTVLALPP
eukprot:scaffold186090_cov34-Tisochrysis_lutea.AAC.1